MTSIVSSTHLPEVEDERPRPHLGTEPQLDELLEAAEDLEYIRLAAAARAEMAESGESPIPWEEVKADLGLA